MKWLHLVSVTGLRHSCVVTCTSTFRSACLASWLTLLSSVKDIPREVACAFGTERALVTPYADRIRQSQFSELMNPQKRYWRPDSAMFRLDYLSCLLTVLATILVGRKLWTGLVVSGVNSVIVCVIGFHTSQFGFIPANLFCICIYAFSIRSWIKERTDAQKNDKSQTRHDSVETGPQIPLLQSSVPAA